MMDLDEMAIIAARQRGGRNRRALEQRYADVLTKLEKAERELARVAKKWDKHRLTARRYERLLDRMQQES